MVVVRTDKVVIFILIFILRRYVSSSWGVRIFVIGVLNDIEGVLLCESHSSCVGGSCLELYVFNVFGNLK